jgi:hypothetical protein
VLDEEELIRRCDEAVNLPEVEKPVCTGRIVRVERGRDVRERHVGVVLSQGWPRPFGHQRQQARHGQTALQRFSAGHLICHRLLLPKSSRFTRGADGTV